MLTFDISLFKGGRAYFPRAISSQLGRSLKAISNRNIVLLYTEGIELPILARSVELILEELRLECEVAVKVSPTNYRLAKKKSQ